jgi:hypothetical protein
MPVICDGPCRRVLGKGDTMHTWSPDVGELVLTFCSNCNPKGDTMEMVASIAVGGHDTEVPRG